MNRRQVLSLLEALEWCIVDPNVNTVRSCPVCYAEKGSSHKTRCTLSQLLELVRGKLSHWRV